MGSSLQFSRRRWLALGAGTVAAATAARFNPLTDALTSDKGERVKLDAPAVADELPRGGFVFDEKGYQAPPADSRGLDVIVNPASDRLALLAPVH